MDSPNLPSSTQPPAPFQGHRGPPLRPGGTPLIRPPLLRPRKVRGGVKVPSGEVGAGKAAWAAQRWLRLAEAAAPGVAMVEGLEYARLGQTRRMNVLPSKVEAGVQGRSDRAYVTTITLPILTTEQWDQVVLAMSEGAIYAAKLLAGELPPNIEDVFVPLGHKLFPTETAELGVSCTCGAGPGVWCKHVCCVAYLVAHRLASEPFLMFSMRGLEGSELIERLRQRRTIAGAVGGSTPVYVQRIPGLSDGQTHPLEESLAQFWESGPSLTDLDLPLAPPQVSHPLLRRLGTSPFQTAAFPLVGLLASCYEVISEAALRTGESGGASPEPVEGASDEADSDGEPHGEPKTEEFPEGDDEA